MTSYSPISIFLIFIGSLLFVSLAFIERAYHKVPIRTPEQIIVLVMGITGLIYSTLLTYLKLKPYLG